MVHVSHEEGGLRTAYRRPQGSLAGDPDAETSFLISKPESEGLEGIVGVWAGTGCGGEEFGIEGGSSEAIA